MTIDNDDLSCLAERCAKCGACTSVCPVYQVTGRESHTPRGRLHLLGRHTSPSSSTYGALFSACLACGACLDACPRQIDTLSLMIAARHEIPLLNQPHFAEKLLARKSLTAPSLLSGLARLRQNLLKRLPQSSGLRHKLSLLPEDFALQPLTPIPAEKDTVTSPAEINYFSGCLARYLSHDISRATEFLVNHFSGKGIETPEKQTCCGLASFASGNRKEAQKLARKNITAFTDNTWPILTSCASCYSHLRSYPKLLADDPDWSRQAELFAERLLEFSQFLDTQVSSSPGSNQAELRVFYHDPCHLRFGAEKITSPPRQLIEKICGQPPQELPLGPHCCGQGGLFTIAHPDISKKIMSGALAEFKELSSDMVVTTCSGCLLQWQQGLQNSKETARARHLAVFLAEWIKR